MRVNRSAGRKPLAAQMSPFTSTGGVPNKLQMIAASKGQVKSAERPATDARTKLVADVMLAASKATKLSNQVQPPAILSSDKKHSQPANSSH